MLAFSQQLNSKAELDAAYQKFAAPKEPAVLEAARKTAIRDRGPVYRVDRPELTAAADLAILTAALNGSGIDKPALTFDDPDYVAWKGFSAGAKASYVFRGMLPPRPGSAEWTGGRPTGRFTYLLQSIDEEQARLWFSEIAYDYPSGAAHPARDREIGYPAQRPAAAKRARAGEQHESGEETLNINGRNIATRWESLSFPNGSCKMITKTWPAMRCRAAWSARRKTVVAVRGDSFGRRFSSPLREPGSPGLRMFYPPQPRRRLWRALRLLLQSPAA
jgi:hypothetical protein